MTVKGDESATWRAYLHRGVNSNYVHVKLYRDERFVTSYAARTHKSALRQAHREAKRHAKRLKRAYEMSVAL